MKTAGQAGTEVNVIDASTLIATGLKGVTGFMGITERGKEETPILVGSWEEYQTKFGGFIAESDFPKLVKRALDSGARLKISRAVAHTNVLTPNSIIGTKASLSLTTSLVAETLATATLVVTATGTAGDKVQIRVLVGGLPKLLGIATVPATPTTSTVATAVAAAINANTSAHGFSASASTATVTVTANAGSGAGANTFAWNNIITGTLAITANAFTGGVSAVQAVTASFSAANIGTWANSKLWVKSVASSTVTNAYDLTFGIDGSIAPDITVPAVVANPSADTLLGYNALIYDYASITAITVIGAFGKTYFTGGAEDKTLISDIDYIGDASTRTGIHSFDTDVEITKLAVPSLANPIIDKYLADYADARKDLRVFVRTPLGVSGSTAIAYRNGTTPYNHTAINSWRASMFYGGLLVTDPVTGLEAQSSELGDIAAIYSNKDNKSVEWFSAAGSKRGTLKNVRGVINNLYSPALRTTADAVSIAGINAIVNHPTFGPVLWDNVTLYKANSLLKFDNVAELMIYLTRAVKPITEAETFDPNDIDTWKTICRNIKPLFETVKTGRGIWDYVIQGDQDIDSIDQAVINDPNQVDAGAYKVRIFVKPKVGMKFIGVDMIVTNSGVSFEDVEGTI